MKSIEKIKSQINDEAIAFLRNGLYAELLDDCPKYVYLSITEGRKNEDPERYETDLTIFKALFNAGNEITKLLCGIV